MENVHFSSSAKHELSDCPSSPCKWLETSNISNMAYQSVIIKDNKSVPLGLWENTFIYFTVIILLTCLLSLVKLRQVTQNNVELVKCLTISDS